MHFHYVLNKKKAGENRTKTINWLEFKWMFFEEKAIKQHMTLSENMASLLKKLPNPLL